MGQVNSENVDRLTMTNFDIEKFASGTGMWYEIAHNVPLQKGCDNSSVQYKVQGNTISVVNVCYKEGKKASVISGIAHVPDSNVKSKLIIKFEGLRRNVNYWIYDTDYNNYAIIGNESGYFWILSKSSTMTFCNFKNLLLKLENMGFKTREVITDYNVLTPCTSGEMVY